MPRFRPRWLSLFLVGAILWLASQPSSGAPSPVQELRVQTVGDKNYFHVRLNLPPNLVEDTDRFRNWWEGPSPSLAPRLVDSEGKLQVVCRRFDPNANRGRPSDDRRFRDKDEPLKDSSLKDGFGPKDRPGPRGPEPIRGLEFIGRCNPGIGEVTAKLIYPVPGRPLPIIGTLTRQPPPPVWREMEVVLDFKNARVVALPREAKERKEQEPWLREDPRDLRKDEAPRRRFGPHQPPVGDDLEGLWARAQVDQFRDLAREVRDFGFYRFAAETTARKYRVQMEDPRFELDWNRDRQMFGPVGPVDRQLYNLTTGASAITESLQMRRMNRVAPRGDGERVVPIAEIQGIDIAEHPWKKMLEGKKPADEPMAKMIPHDNYYLTFRNPAKMLAFATLLDQWGGNINRAFEFTSRDYRLWDRYEQQLGLKTSAIAKNLGSLGIKGVGVTGSDAYLQDGTDITLLLQATDPGSLVAALDQMLAEARKKFGARLKESKSSYQGTTIESRVTPYREVSLHRAILGDVVLLSNSKVGLQRVLDTAQGRGKRLSDSLDFQYMRVVFRADDPTEDGFLYLPDAFIRKFVGPESRIKQKRRLEALVSLNALTCGAMLTAWETGKTPTSTPNLLEVAGIRGEEVPVPDGKPATWDSEQLVAASEVYGTIHFATPLVEIDATKATQIEAEEYRRFRMDYLGLWRQFFDPIGMRLAMKDGQVKLETYILPLIQNSAYNQLRRVTGSGSFKFDPSSISAKTLVQYMLHLGTDVNERMRWVAPFGPGRVPGPDVQLAAMMAWAIEPLGEWILLRIDESPNYEKLVRMAEQAARGHQSDIEDVARMVWTLPLAVGVDVKNPMTVAAALMALRTSAMLVLPGGITWGPLDQEYKGVPIVRVGATRAGRRMMGIGPGQPGPFRREPFLPALYYAMIDGGLYVSLNEEMMRSLIDQTVARKEGKGELVEAASSLYVSPGAAEQTKGLIKRLVEIQTNQAARTALPIWYALYRANIVPPDAKPEAAADAAYRYLGYVPVSPDGTAFRYDRGMDEVRSERHGSLRKPILERTTADNASFNQLLESLKSIRADLRFREDGIHTVLTMDRAKVGK